MPSVVKHSFIQAKVKNARAKAKAHLNYIQHRSGRDKEDGGRQFFDKDRDETDGADFRRAVSRAPNYGTVMHKMILSPGVQGVNLKEYTREVMEELGESRGLDLQWQAVIHTNTDHDHVHVTVLGFDRNRGMVKFGKHDYDHARSIGDRYLERKHEFDRYYDKSLDKMVRTEQPERGLDLDKLTDTYYRPEKEFEKKNPKKKQKREDKSFHDDTRTSMPYRRKGRRQRLHESRGRKEQDYFHDLYVSNTNRQRLEQLREARPDLKDSIEQQLAGQDRHDAERRAEIAKQVEQLERIIGITPYQPKQKEVAKDGKDSKPPEKEIDGKQLGEDRKDTEKQKTREYKHDDIDLEKVSDKDKIQLASGAWVSKYDSFEHLDATRLKLTKGPFESRLSPEQFSTLCRWIGTKKEHGEKCYGEPPLKPDKQQEQTTSEQLGEEKPQDRSQKTEKPEIPGKEPQSDELTGLDEKPPDKPEKTTDPGKEKKEDEKTIEPKGQPKPQEDPQKEQKQTDLTDQVLKEMAELEQGLIKAQERQRQLADQERLRRQKEEEEEQKRLEEERKQQEEEELRKKQMESGEEEEE